MGVDYYTCENNGCRHNFPDCGDYFSCDCGAMFCSIECGGRQTSQESEDENTCILCRGESVTDWSLLQFLLKHYSITREEATKLYKKEVLDFED